MQGMKYIVVENDEGDLFPFLFPITFNHADFAETMKFENKDVRSAGMVTIGTNGPKCFGSSVSLNKYVHEDDADLILRNIEP